MKKLLLTTLVLVAGIAQADFWDNCTAYGGTIITANSYGNDKGGLCNDPSNPELTNNCNGKRFCRSGNTMNWWSGFTWCESIGGKFASFDSLCPNTQLIHNGICDNMKGTNSNSGGCWFARGTGTVHGAHVRLHSGLIWATDDAPRNASRFGIGGPFVLCEEK